MSPLVQLIQRGADNFTRFRSFRPIRTFFWSLLISSLLMGLLLILSLQHLSASDRAAYREAQTAADRCQNALSANPVAERNRDGAPSSALCALLDPTLARALAQAGPNDLIPVIVVLREQAEPEAVVRLAASPAQARARLIVNLRALADRAQAPLQAYLEAERVAGRVTEYIPFWIFNGLTVRARPEVIRALAARPEIAIIRLDQYRQWIPTPSPLSHPSPALQEREGNIAKSSGDEARTEWNLIRIRAPEVWASLGISGTGVVVAGMDTGADWLHPALQANYRGYNPRGPARHWGNWYDPVTRSLYPIDDHGHGTHTLGIAVGREGIGIAPGARWIGVKVLDRRGYGYDSWIHAGFQWLLAPNNDPTLAPDVVNCSWGSEDATSTIFQNDLRVLRAAGIFVVFANGNRGPGPRTVLSPASLPEAFAVGATDGEDRIASFSSRGPSPWGEIRPHVVAPGVAVRSALPGGVYHAMSGTSMASPHVAGLVALLRSVNSTLDITQTAFLITSTAIPLSSAVSNNDAGWGRIDAFAAVASLMNAGVVQGMVVRAGDGAPIPGATVTAAFHGNGGGGSATTDGSGRYRLSLAPGPYDLTVRAFGYASTTLYGVIITPGATVTANFVLTPLPTGILRVSVTDGATGAPLIATLTVLDTPLETVASTAEFVLPAGIYAIRARALGHYVITTTAQVTPEKVVAITLALPPAPSILLVDSGAWYYGSQIAYYRQALDDLSLAYDEWIIRQPPDDTPTADVLAPYDVVIWSAPQDAPGYIGAQDAITTYLSAGGRLFLSGQDIGFLDAWMPYYEKYLKARLVEDTSNLWTLKGLPGGPFFSLTLSIAGPGGADNQQSPDVITPADLDAAIPILAYAEDGYGGIAAGTCLNYRAIYLSFGFEAIHDRETRREVMRRALDWLTAPAPDVGLELRVVGAMRTSYRHTAIGPPGTVVTHKLRVRNTGRGSTPDIVNPILEGADWLTRLSASYLSLPACTSATLTVSVTVPTIATWNAHDVLTLTLRSTISSSLSATAILTSKAPAPILLVDDDRWYEQVEKYRSAMETAGLPYDLWETHAALGSGGQGSPPAEILRWYPIIVWWTGYDWYEPVNAQEELALMTYLKEGGRLFLTSQDFLYYHTSSPLRPLLGVLTHTEDVTPTVAMVVPENPVGLRGGPWPLTYPYRNFSDGLVPTPGTAVALRDEIWRGIGLARRGIPKKGFAPPEATVFFSFPWETLPEEARSAVIRQVVGYLSWLGGSSFFADRGAASAGATINYTLRLLNDGPIPIIAAVSNAFPSDLGTAPTLVWTGTLSPGEPLTFILPVTLTTGLSPGTAVPHTVRIALIEQGIVFSRTAVIRVNAPDLGASTLRCEPRSTKPREPVTCILRLTNTGPVDASRVTVQITGTLRISDVPWTGPLRTGETITLTWKVIPSVEEGYVVALIEDEVGGRWERPSWVKVQAWRAYLPLILRSR
ncbi:MAG: S8 family serine peptidase [Anaerolineae bacterium]|nr:S8 family serine peptidase [Anaerolineae bacterium]MDW8100171.1 S8 family serine peptidase [Anaerolineae bacterium]